MKKIITNLLILVLLCSIVYASATRTIADDTIAQGSETEVTYTATASFFTIRDTLATGWSVRTTDTCTINTDCPFCTATSCTQTCTGGFCNIDLYNNQLSWFSSGNSFSVYFVAPNQDTILNLNDGTWEDANGNTGDLTDDSITVGNPNICDPVCSDGNPCTNDVCSAGTCSYPNKADGVVCTSGGEEGTCQSGNCVVDEPTCADLCGAWSDCVDDKQTRTCDAGSGCSEEKSCAPEKCEFWEKKVGGECEVNMSLIVILFIGLFLLRMF